MVAAVVKSLFFYFLCFAAAAIVYCNTSSHYAHGPSLYHLVIVLTVLVGFVWLLMASGQFYINRSKHLLGYMLVNGVAVISFAIFIGYLTYQNKKHKTAFSEEGGELLVAKMGDSTLMYHRDNLIYLEVKDSVYFDFRDNAAK